MSYRATPLSNGHSPAELLVTRCIRTKVAIPSASLELQLHRNTLQNEEKEYRLKMKCNFDHHHAAKALLSQKGGQEVVVPDRNQFGTVQDKKTERSYLVKTTTGTYRRNRIQLKPMPVSNQCTAGEPQEGPGPPKIQPTKIAETPTSESPPAIDTSAKTT